MPTSIFDWMARTAMLVMAGLVTLSILGAIAAMTNDPGTRSAAPRDRPPIGAEQAEERAQEAKAKQAEQAEQAPSRLEERNAATAPGAEGPVATAGPAQVSAAAQDKEDEEARWLEAIAYALLAIAGICALGVLMLWNVVRELRRIGDSPMR